MTDRSHALRLAVPSLLFLASAAVLFLQLGEPSRIIFDETYYVDDARDYLDHGVEDSFAVHPPVGKWMIAAGIALLGDDAFGWRAAGALSGAVIVLLTYLTGTRLLRHRGVAAFAALLVATDGLFFVQARTSMLDIFLALFVMLGAWLLVVDHDASGLSAAPPGLETDLEADLGDSGDPRKEHPPPLPRRGHLFRWLAGLSFGLAAATKWSAALAIAAAILVSLGWEVALRRGWGLTTLGRVAGLGMIGVGIGAIVGVIVGAVVLGGVDVTIALLGAGGGGIVALLLDAPLRRAIVMVLASLALVPVLVYVVSYMPWMANYEHTTEGGDECLEDDGTLQEPCDATLFDRIEGWGRYQASVWSFHRDLTADHPYRAPAYTWPVLARPVVYYWETCTEDRARGVPKTDEDGEVEVPDPCVVAQGDAAEIIALGNPALWWGFIGAALTLVAGLVRRDRRAAFIVTFWALQFVPWLFVSRPVFLFYMVPVVPFLALGVAYAAVWLSEPRRLLGLFAGALLGAAAGFGVGFAVRAIADSSRATWWVWMGVGWLVGGAIGALVDRDLEVHRGVPERDRAWVRHRPVGVWLAAGVAVAAVGLFIYFYPVLSGIPMADDLVRQRWWIRPGWI
ncbi:MAG: phospholipid carrier-dependent glycosyltransferase [Actinobacteria bacterium]|nr:phospholipid carrier-dependent glycosyltransferase [Actinomycetota bacterium]